MSRARVSARIGLFRQRHRCDPWSGRGDGFQGAFDEEPDCTQAVPTAWTLPTSADERKRLDVRVLIDVSQGITPAYAKEQLEPAATTFEPLGIDLHLTYDTFHLTGELDDMWAVMERVKDHYDGRRPRAADVVYMLTDQDIAGPVAGMADCIGGIADAETAFAFGEINDRYDRDEPSNGDFF